MSEKRVLPAAVVITIAEAAVAVPQPVRAAVPGLPAHRIRGRETVEQIREMPMGLKPAF